MATDKDTLVKAETDRLMALFAGSDTNKLDFIREQVKQLAFLNVSISELQQKINQDGTMVTYSNGGGQEGVRTNPDVKTLVDFQKLAIAIAGKLLPEVPEKLVAGKLEEFFRMDLENV